MGHCPNKPSNQKQSRQWRDVHVCANVGLIYPDWPLVTKAKDIVLHTQCCIKGHVPNNIQYLVLLTQSNILLALANSTLGISTCKIISSIQTDTNWRPKGTFKPSDFCSHTIVYIKHVLCLSATLFSWSNILSHLHVSLRAMPKISYPRRHTSTFLGSKHTAREKPALLQNLDKLMWRSLHFAGSQVLFPSNHTRWCWMHAHTPTSTLCQCSEQVINSFPAFSYWHWHFQSPFRCPKFI